MRLSSRRAPVWVALLLALGASGCTSRSQLDTPLSPAALSRLDPEPAASPLPEPLRELLLQVAAVRGLEPGPTPTLVALPARQLARRAREQFARDVPEAVRRAQAQLLWRLELVPRDFDLAATIERALVGQLRAFYVGAPPTLFVDSTLTGAARQRAVAHELVHALQDDRHAIARRLEYAPDGWDRQSALHALAEGDALAVVERMYGAEVTDSSELAPAAVPGVIACSLAAPYVDGRARVNEVLASGGFGAVDALLQDPPQSTHQLVHPGEPAASAGSEPSFPASGSDWRSVYSDSLGEQSLRCVLSEWASESVAAELAGGWAADRLSSFARGAETAVVWELTFDHPSRAAQVARWFAAKGPASAPVSEWLCEAHSDTGVVGVLRRGSRVVFASLTDVPIPDGCVSLEGWVRAP